MSKTYDAAKAIISRNVEMLIRNLPNLGQKIARRIKSDVNQTIHTTSSGANMAHKCDGLVIEAENDAKSNISIPNISYFILFNRAHLYTVNSEKWVLSNSPYLRKWIDKNDWKLGLHKIHFRDIMHYFRDIILEAFMLIS